MEFLKNVYIIKLNGKKRIHIQNNEIFELIYNIPSQERMKLRILRKIPYRKYLIRKLAFKSKITLLELYKPKFKLNAKSFQIPCSLKSSVRRAVTICQRLYFNSQKALFIGDDDLVSILCKFIIPKLPITVIEIDGRITRLLKNIALKHNFQDFNVYNLDFKEVEEIKEHLDIKFSLIHLDPPYEAKELQKFSNSIDLVQDKHLVQIFLNGLFDINCISIINNFITKNKLIISEFSKSFNSYSFKSTDSKYIKNVRKHLKRETDLKFKINELKKIEFSSDLYILERSMTEQDINSNKSHNLN